MQNDDKQLSHERLDETDPERNRRSFFDWLRGKEETEEEKLRKKLDEELKEAARKRATEFEEERRVEEQREVAETRKLKKRWRTKLVEKSKRLLEEASERSDEPTNGYEIAKLMVAERIVKLHDILATEDLRRSEMKTLKIHIDFMGLLSEKLDKPELEVPQEVEQLYQTIAASVEETTGDTPPQIADNEPETAPISEEDAAYTAFAGSIVKAIRRTLRPEETAEPLHPNGGDSERTEKSPYVPAATPERREERPDNHSPQAEQLLSVVKGTALSGEALRKEIFHTEQARHLADVVEKAAIIDRYVAYEAKKSMSIPDPEKETSPPEKGFELPPNKKIKHLSELELVTLAKTVGIGGGRLLSDAYKKGELDREGLIKVLESYHKGRDYRSEFTLRREKLRRHRQSSPEYLAHPAASQTSTPSAQRSVSSNPEKASERLKNLGRRTISLPFPPETTKSESRDIGPDKNPPTIPTKRKIPELSRLVDSAKERLKRQSQVALLLASVFLIIIVVIVIIEFNSF